MLRFLVLILSLIGSLASADNLLEACPDKPNCVSSQADSESKWYIDPLAFDSTPESAFIALMQATQNIGGELIEQNENRLAYLFVTSLFRFKDDLILILNIEESVIHVRSASRIGYSDFGANRKRVEKLRAEFNRLLKMETQIESGK